MNDLLNKIRTSHTVGLISVLIAAVLWSTGGVFIKKSSLNAVQLASFRSFFAALTFLVIFRKNAFNFNLKTFFNSIFYAAILILFVLATKLTTAANAIFLQYTAPFYVLVFEPIINKTKLEKINVITGIICLFGMILFFIDKLQAGYIIGNIVALLSGVAFAAYLIGTRNNKPEYQYSTIFYGNIIIFFFGLYNLLQVNSFSLNEFYMISYLGIFQIGIAYAFFSFGLKKVLAIEASLISMIEPVLNPVWVYFGYGEQPGITAIAGGIIILFTITIRTIITERRKYKTT